MPVVKRFKPEFLQRERARKLFNVPGELTQRVGEWTLRRKGGKERIVFEEVRGLPELKAPLPMSSEARVQLARAALTPSERDAYARAYGASLRQWATYFPQEERFSLDRMNQVIKNFANPAAQQPLRVQYLVARKETGEVAGMTLTSVAPRGRMGLLAYAVLHPDYRGSGLAQEMVKRNEDFARSHGATHFFWEAEPYGTKEAQEYTQLTALPANALSPKQKTRLQQLTDARKRLAFTQKTGFKVDPDWVHAHTLVAEGEPAIPLWLLVKPLDEKPVDSTGLKLKQLALYKYAYRTPQRGARIAQANIGKKLNLLPPKKALQLADEAAAKSRKRR